MEEKSGGHTLNSQALIPSSVAGTQSLKVEQSEFKYFLHPVQAVRPSLQLYHPEHPISSGYGALTRC